MKLRLGYRPFICLWLLMTCLVACEKNKTPDVAKTQTAAPEESSEKAGEVQTDAVTTMNNLIFDVREAIQFKHALQKIHDMATNQPAGPQHHIVKLYDALLYPLLSLESLVWRLSPYLKKSDVMYVPLVRLMRAIRYRNYLYGEHIYGFLVYLTWPNADVKRFGSAGDLQTWFLEDLAPKLRYSIKAAKSLMQEKYDFKVDMKLFSGKGKFISEAHEFLKFRTEFLGALIASYERTLATGLYLCAYNLDKVHGLINELAKNSLANSPFKIIGGLLTRDQSQFIRPQTPADIYQLIKSNKFKDLLTLKKGAQKLLDESYELFNEANQLELASFESMLTLAKGLSVEQSKKLIFNPKFLEFEAEETRAKLKKRIKLFTGPTTIIGSVTGDVMTLNAKSLFSGHKDLKAFLPNKYLTYDDNQEYKKINDNLWHLRYDKGLPTAWPDPTFGGFMPKNKPDTVHTSMRALVLNPETASFRFLMPVP